MSAPTLAECQQQAAHWRAAAAGLRAEAAAHPCGPYRHAIELSAEQADRTAQHWEDRAARFCPVFRVLTG